MSGIYDVPGYLFVNMRQGLMTIMYNNRRLYVL